MKRWFISTLLLGLWAVSCNPETYTVKIGERECEIETWDGGGASLEPYTVGVVGGVEG